MTDHRRIGAVVLAAGEASRFGAPKQHLLLPHVLARLAKAPVDELVVVAGAHPLQAAGARIVTAADWKLGPGASLRAGLAALAPDTAAAVICLADGPMLAPRAVERVVKAWAAGAGSLLAASYGGKRGHPVVLDRSAWNMVPDEGMRALSVVLVGCDDLGPPGDVDTPADLDGLELDRRDSEIPKGACAARRASPSARAASPPSTAP